MTEKALAKTDSAGVADVAFRASQDVALIKQQYLPNGTDQQLRLLLAFGHNKGLDLVSRQYYGVIRKTQNGPVMTIQIGIDGLRAIAQRTGEYDSQDGPYWCGPDGEWVDVWLKDEPPAAARVGIRRKDSPHVTYHVARYREYVQMVPSGWVDGKPSGQRPNEMWDKMPANQLAKCAEAGALRKACPQAMARLAEDDGEEFEVSFSNGDAPATTSEPPVRRPPAPIEPPRSRSEARKPAVVDEDGIIEGEASEIDYATGEIIDADPPSQPAPAAANTPPVTPTQQPAMGLEDTGEPPASEKELQSFWISAGNLGWDNARVHELAGVSTVNGLSSRQLTALKIQMAERNRGGR